MKRADGLYELSRRRFCALAAGAAGAGLVVGCSSSSVTSPDAHQGSGSPDAPTGGACTTTATDVGPATMFVLGQPVYFSSGRFFVVRDSGGLYALSAQCTHQGQTICIGTTNNCSSSGTEFFCPRHGAVFTFAGAVVAGPAFAPLPHYGMCDLANGHVGVSTGTTVAASVRLAG